MKTKTRKEINEAIANNNKEIERLYVENDELSKQSILLCDEDQWYTEKTERHKVGRKIEMLLIGRINWKEGFTDEDTGDVIYIDRSQIVRVNGEWKI